MLLTYFFRERFVDCFHWKSDLVFPPFALITACTLSGIRCFAENWNYSSTFWEHRQVCLLFRFFLGFFFFVCLFVNLAVEDAEMMACLCRIAWIYSLVSVWLTMCKLLTPDEAKHPHTCTFASSCLTLVTVFNCSSYALLYYSFMQPTHTHLCKLFGCNHVSN